MAGALGDLVIALHADTAAFQSDMGRAARISEREWGKMAGHAEAAGKAIGLAAIAAGAAALKMGSDFINAAADLDDMAEKTGASVEELSKLEQRAYISGVALETVEMGLVRLTKALHGNDEEAKGAGKALAALGLRADELRNKDTAESLRIVANELNKYEDGAGKTALALDLFGKAGAQLLPFLKDMANDGELNARVTAEQAAQAEQLGKQWRALTNEAKGLGQAIALEAMPWIAKMLEQLSEGIRIAGGFANALRLFGLSGINSDNAGQKIKELNDQLERTQSILDNPTLMKSMPAGFGDRMRAQMEDVRKQIEFAKLLQLQGARALGGADTRGEMQRFGLSGQKLPLNYESADKAAKDAVKKTALTAEQIAKLQADAEEEFEKSASQAFNFVADMQKKLNDRQYFENIYGEERLLGMSIEDIRALHKSVLDGADEMIEAGDAAARAYAGFDENGKALIETTEKADDLAKSLGLTFSSAFEDAVINGKKFRDVLQGIAKDIARILLRKTVTEPLANAAGDFLKRGLGEIFKGVFGGGDAPAPTVGGEMGYAIGTNYVPRTGLALVHQGEAIIPASENRRGGGINFTQINQIDSRTDAAQVGHYMAVAEQRAVASMRDLDRRTVK